MNSAISARVNTLLIAGVLIAAALGAHAGEGARRDLSALKPFEGEHPIAVVATTGMIADVAGAVGGELVDVQALMGEGVDPHLYKASPRDVFTLRKADLILYNGLHLEGKMADMLERLARRQRVVAVADGVPEERLIKQPGTADAYDPHIWFDLSIWRHAVTHVRDALKRIDASHAGAYDENAAAFLEELDALHAWTKEEVASIPEARRVMVTAHDAFVYFGRAYAIEVLAIQGISTESEAGVFKINQLVQTLVSREIKAVFVETSVSDKNIKALVEGCAARGHNVRIGGELFSDAMGAEGTPEGTYFGMLRHNVETIVGALK